MVVVGAGFDTGALRRQWPPGLRGYYEVEFPPVPPAHIAFSLGVRLKFVGSRGSRGVGTQGGIAAPSQRRRASLAAQLWC